jgi:hypothetical protein
MRKGGTLVALVLVASCDTGSLQKATSTPLPDVSAPELEAGPGDPQAAGDAESASTDATITAIHDAASSSADSAGDASSLGSLHPDAAPGVSLDATDLDAPGPEPGPIGCGVDAAEAGFCPLPSSWCADRRWLTFYDNAQCISAVCTWEKRYVDCGSIGCFFGQCQPPLTAQAAP